MVVAVEQAELQVVVERLAINPETMEAVVVVAVTGEAEVAATEAIMIVPRLVADQVI